MVSKGCDTCKYEQRDIQDYPCRQCSYSYTEKYEPKTNADKIRDMSDEELADCLLNMCNFIKDDGYMPIYNSETEKKERNLQ